MRKLTDKAAFYLTVALAAGILMLIAGTMVLVDPLFHFHKPIRGISYDLSNGFYQNDGIARHFDYDTVISGASTSECFSVSECGRLFDGQAIKVPYAGASLREIALITETALDSGRDVKTVIIGLDDHFLIMDKNECRNDVTELDYLRNDVLFDDVEYMLNKSMFRFLALTAKRTLLRQPSTDMDDYLNWSKTSSFGKERVLDCYDRPLSRAVPRHLTDEEAELVKGNVTENIIEIAQKNPGTDFCFFIPPYSICYWDEKIGDGTFYQLTEAEKLMVRMLLEHDNIKVFAFLDEYELICDLDNYKDQGHYGDWINSQILQWMAADEHRLTKENYEEYYKEITDFYTGYDYSKLWED